MAGAKSKVEQVKEDSRQLRGHLGQEFGAGGSHVDEESKQLLKFHGLYQQEDRDERKARRGDGREKAYSFMVRSRIPGGRLSPEQYLVHDDLATTHGNGTLRITTRQDFQLHGVLKGDVRATLRGIDRALLTTFAACGDVVRNVMLCPAPPADDVQRQIERHARAIAERLLPQSRAYHELWLDGERVIEEPALKQDDEEPIYGRTYLPRKFKIAMGSPGDNCVEVQTQDIGIVPVVEHGALAGFNVLAGGGLGMTHNKPETFPRLGDAVGFVPPERLLAVVEGIVVIHRDHGDRADRRHARLKYLLHDRGVDWLRAELEAALGFRIEPARPVPPLEPALHLGWQPEADGRFSLGLSIENGRVRDDGDRRLRSALRAIVERFRPGVRLTPSQDILLVGIAAADRAPIDALLGEHGVPRPESLSPARLHSMACPALPTCGLALAEAERALPSVIDELEVALTECGLGRETITVRMTGCPNGCARPYVAEIGFVGRSLDRYAVFVGGRGDASRLNKLFADLVPRDALVPTLRPLLFLYRDERRLAESFGDFCDRLGVDGLQARIAERASTRRGPRPARPPVVRPRPEVRLHG